MQIAVTGANGLVGSRLCARLAESGEHEVAATSRGLDRVGGRTRSVRYTALELRDRDAVLGWLRDVRPETLIHCASMTDVDACEKDPAGAYAHNVEATAHLAFAAREFGFHLVHVSTDYVFD